MNHNISTMNCLIYNHSKQAFIFHKCLLHSGIRFTVSFLFSKIDAAEGIYCPQLHFLSAKSKGSSLYEYGKYVSQCD